MATTLQRIKQSEIRRPGPTVSRSLILGYMESLEELFCVPTKSIPQELRGQGDFTSLAKIREKQEKPLRDLREKQAEQARQDAEEFEKDCRLSEYDRQNENGAEAIDYGVVDEELVMSKYFEFAGKLVELGVLSLDDVGVEV